MQVKDIAEEAAAVIEVNAAIRNILLEQFEVGDAAQSAGYKAYATLAAEVGVSVANIFLALQNKGAGRTYVALCDLVYQLNANKFWVDNASAIHPLIVSALSAHKDSGMFELDRHTQDTYALHDGLWYASIYAPLEIFTQIALLLGGPALLNKHSTTIKTALMPYFRR